MSLDLIENPFASTAGIDLDKKTIREAAPTLPDTKLNDLVDAAGTQAFDLQEGVNERFLLQKRYMSVASHISAELGPFTLDQFATAQPLVEAGALRLLNEGDDTGSFRGTNASGGSQYDMQGITTETFDGTGKADRPYSLDNSGSQTNGTDVVEAYTLDTNNQSVFIMGYYQSTNPRAVNRVQVEVDDGDTRSPDEIYSHMNLGTLQAVDAPSIEYIDEGDTVTVGVERAGSSAVDTDFYPYGVDLNTAANFGDITA